MARRKSSRGRVFYYPSSLPKMQDGDRIGNKKGKREDLKIESVLDKGIDLEGLKEGISQAESVGGILLMNPESTATGLYGQRFSEIKDTDLYSGTREEFSKDFEAQNAVFDKRFYEGLASTETTPLEKDAYDLYKEYKPQIKNFNYSLEDLAALSNFLGRQGTRTYLGKVVRDGNTLEETFPTKFGKGAEQANKTPEEYLKITRPFYKQEDKISDRPNSSNKPGSSIKPNPNVRTPEEVMAMLVGRDYTRTPKESNYNPYGKVVKEIMDENKALYNVGAPKKFNIIPADERMAQHLKKTGRGLEYLDAEDTWIPFKDRPTAKLGIPGEGANRVVINTKNIKDKDLKEAVALDFLSHSMDEDKTYKKYKDKINTELVNKYGQEFIDRNGGIDAYVRGILASRDNKEYQPYKEETGFLNKALVNDFKKYIKTGEEPSNGLFNFKFGGGITENGTEDTEKAPIQVAVANESTTWNPKFTDILNHPENYSLTELTDALDKITTLYQGFDKIIFKEGVSPSEAGTRYVDKDPATGLPKLKSGGIPERYKNKGFTKVGVKKQSTRPGKKWMVLAKKGDDYKIVHGGYKGMKDFSQHGSEDRKKKFWSRMGGKNSSKAQDPFSPLYWHKRFGTWEYGGDIQQQGYKDDEYYFPGANVVREMPLKDTPLYFSPFSKGLTKYQTGGQLPKDQEGKTIYTSELNDPRLLSYRDSSALYDYSQLQRQLEDGYVTLFPSKQQREKQSAGQFELQKAAADLVKNNPNISWMDDRIAGPKYMYQGQEVIPGSAMFNEIGIENLEIVPNRDNSPDLSHITIKPSGTWMGKGQNFDYPKPKTKVVYKPETRPTSTRDKKSSSTETIQNKYYYSNNPEIPLEYLERKEYTPNMVSPQVVFNPFEGEGTFRRSRQPQEKGSALYDTEGKKYSLVDYYDKKTGERVGTYNPMTNQVIVEYQTGGQLPRAEIMIDPATGLPKLKKGGKAWIQGAIKKPGALRATAKRAGAIKSDGTIKKSWLREKARGKGKTAQRARLAITLGKMRK